MENEQDLQAIRAKRLAEMQGNYKGFNNEQDQEKAAEEKQRREEMRHGMLSRILDQDARARLNTIMVAKPEKGQMVENLLLQMAQRGQIQSQIGEDALKGLLEKVSHSFQVQKTTVKFDRRRAAMDDSDDELDV